MVEFVSYDGKYPNLCNGRLILRINGVVVDFGKYCLISGGRVCFDSDWCEHVSSGAWEVINIPEGYERYVKEITEVVNENIPWGCCGGCV